MKTQHLLIFLFLYTSVAFGQGDKKTRTVENGGNGPFKAVISGEESLPNHTIYCPENLETAAKAGKLPVILFGNGGCANTSASYQNYLNEIASNGYIIIAIGPYWSSGFAPFGDVARQPTSSEQLIEALDWITAQNRVKSSRFYKKVNVKKIALMGQSCGGLQAIEASGDPRISTTVVLNSGVLNAPPAIITTGGLMGLKKDVLNKFHSPVIYIIGDSTDVAFPNAMDDFTRITHVPVVMANLPVGHAGTYLKPNGGAFQPVTLSWLNWQLKEESENASKFIGEACGYCNFEGWRIESKNFIQP